MKILFSCLSKSWGGMEMVSLTEIKELLKRDLPVELLCINESRIHIEANSMGIIIHPISIIGKVHPFASARAASIIKSGNYNIIHTHASKDLWILVPALDIINSSIPLILTKHVGSYIVKKDILHRRLYNRVNLIFAISNAIKKNLLMTLPVKEDKIRLLHNGIDMNKFHPSQGNRIKIRKEFSITDNELVIGMLARFSPGKGHEEFLKAASLMSVKHNNLKFIVIGEASRGEDEYAETIKRMSIDLGLQNVIFSGFRSDIPEMLSALDIFVFPSHSEAFGIALVEAMAMALPSICSNSEGVPDIAVDEKTSLFFESKSYNDLAEKLNTMILSSQMRTAFSLESRRIAEKNFDIAAHINSLINTYNSFQIK